MNPTLRIGFDMDGVLADFAGAYRSVEQRLYGPAVPPSRPGNPEEEDDEKPARAAEDRSATEPPSGRTLRRKRDVVWQTIQATPDFWTTLKPLGDGSVRRIHEMMLRHRWEVFFITQRPATEGDTVQRQTQHWLVDQGFDLPSVLVIHGSRGGAAAALRLDYHVDDSPNNCIDIKGASAARPLLIADPADEAATMIARRLGIGTAASIGDALRILEDVSLTYTQPTLLDRLARLVGWHPIGNRD